jgi:type III restriction enzyme
MRGGRKVRRQVSFYNLDVIISVGYRVKSKRGAQFRQWATRVLREHLVRGFTLAKTSELVTQQTINIPRILVVPQGEVKTGFRPFTLDLKSLNYQAVSDELWIQHLRTNQLEVLALEKGGFEETRLEDYVVSGLINFDDISYDDHAGLLYDLAGQVIRHFQDYLSEVETRKILRCYQRDIARFVHSQMQVHYWEEAVGYEVKVSKGFTELKESAYSYAVAEPPADYRVSPEDKSNMSKFLFGGFERCLYTVQKFDSEAERKLALIATRSNGSNPQRGSSRSFTGMVLTISNTNLISWLKPPIRYSCSNPKPATRWKTQSFSPKRKLR